VKASQPATVSVTTLITVIFFFSFIRLPKPGVAAGIRSHAQDITARGTQAGRAGGTILAFIQPYLTYPQQIADFVFSARTSDK
jgi:hypothetical protein